MIKLIMASLLCLSSTALAQSTLPKNIIMIIGDGMGPAYTTAYRYYKDNPETSIIEQTVFDRHLVGMASTYPAAESGYVTDSAAAATALGSGKKTYNGAIGVDTNKQAVMSVLTWAKQQNKKTGVVVTSQVNHATPAAYLTHNESRKNYNQIADSYINDGAKVDLLLGGGWQYFIRPDRNLIDEFKQAGFHYLDHYNQLDSLPKKQPILGLFAQVGLPWALDDINPHRLTTMTQAANHYLANPQGYFLLIEASQIDWAGHNNDIAAAMAEMDDLAKLLEYLEGYVAQHRDTLVILTADHSTGGFTLGAKGKYIWQPELLRTMTIAPETIANTLSEQKINQTLTTELFNFQLTDKEISQLKAEKQAVTAQRHNYLNNDNKETTEAPKVNEALYKQITNIIDKRTNTGWTSGGHTAIDVPVFAFGKQHEIFIGHQDNTDIAKKLFSLLER